MRGNWNPKQIEQNIKLFERRVRRQRERREIELRERLKEDVFRRLAQPRDALAPLPPDVAFAYRRLLERAERARDFKIAQRVSIWLETCTEFNQLYDELKARFLGRPDAPSASRPASEGALVPVRARPAPRFQLNIPLNPPRIPRPFPRARFSVFEDFQASDVGSRAIVNIIPTFETTKPWSVVGRERTGGGLPPSVEVSRVYRTHPLRQDLTSNMEDLRTGRAPITLSFPSGSGEVMYVITEDYRLVIAARSGHQRDLPHPTLIGGIDPEALSAGIVEFADNRIKKVHINASGHFRPNSPSSIEVSLGLFARLPRNVFHARFEGFSIYGGPGVPAIAQVPHQPAPFNILEGPDTRGTTEATRALARADTLSSFSALTTGSTPRDLDRKIDRLRQRLKQELITGNTAQTVEIFLLPSISMRRLYRQILRSVNSLRSSLNFVPEVREAICAPLGPDPDFQAVAKYLISKMS